MSMSDDAACPCPWCMSMPMLHVHVHTCQCPCCMFMSMEHVRVRAACLWPLCTSMFTSILHHQCFMLYDCVHAECNCRHCMSMSMLHVNVHAACPPHAASPSSCCMSMSMLHVHDHATCPWMSMSMPYSRHPNSLPVKRKKTIKTKKNNFICNLITRHMHDMICSSLSSWWSQGRLSRACLTVYSFLQLGPQNASWNRTKSSWGLSYSCPVVPWSFWEECQPSIVQLLPCCQPQRKSWLPEAFLQ